MQFRDDFVEKYIGNKPGDGKRENRAVFRDLLKTKKGSIPVKKLMAEIVQRHVRSEAEIFDSLSDDLKSKIFAWKRTDDEIDKWIDGHQGGRGNEEQACAVLKINREQHRQFSEEISRLGLSQYVRDLSESKE